MISLENMPIQNIPSLEWPNAIHSNLSNFTTKGERTVVDKFITLLFRNTIFNILKGITSGCIDQRRI